MAATTLSQVRGSSRRSACLVLAKACLDGVEVGRVAGQEDHLAPGRFDQPPRLGALVHVQVVEDHDLARPQAGHQDALDEGGKDPPIDRAIDDQTLAHPRQVQRGQPGDVRPLPPRNAADGPLPAGRACPQRGQGDRRARLIDEEQIARIDRRHPRLPRGAGRLIAFAGNQRLFLSGKSRRASSRLRCDGLSWTPTAAASCRATSGSVASGWVATSVRKTG